MRRRAASCCARSTHRSPAWRSSWIVPPKNTRLHPWSYDQVLYRQRNEIERLFRRLKGFRRIFSRFDKLDVMFTAFIQFALITDMLLSVNTP